MVKVFLVLIAVSVSLVIPIQDARSEPDLNEVTQNNLVPDGAVTPSEVYKPLLISDIIVDPFSQFKKKILTVINGDTILVTDADEGGLIARLIVFNKDIYKGDDTTCTPKTPQRDKKKKKKKGRK
jgi:hypothetical protein